MKRILPSALISLLLLLNACDAPAPTAVPPEMGTAVALTQTAAMWTPTVTPTFNPYEAVIAQWLNDELSRTDELERAIVADYKVVDVSFPAAYTIFRVTMRCECRSNTQCCVPERMFVIAMRAIGNRLNDINGQLPTNVTDMQLVCYNHQSPIGIIGAKWDDVKDYFRGELTSDQFGWRVYKISAP